MSDFDPTAFRTIPHGHAFEEFEVGRRFEHHWGRTLNEGDNSLFTTVVNPFLVLCTVVGLSVEDLSEAGGPFLGIDELTFHRPVYPGDTLTARSEVIAARESGSQPAFGIVTWHTEGFNQNGDLVIDYKRSNLARKRAGK
jgi:acyl dehydratase